MTEKEVSLGSVLRLKGGQEPGSLTEGGVGTEKGWAGSSGSNQTLRNVSNRHQKKGGGRDKIRSIIYSEAVESLHMFIKNSTKT